NEDSGYQFSVRANATVVVNTTDDIYGYGELVNLSTGVLNNTGSVNISGYLRMEVLRNSTLEVLAVQVDDAASGTKREVNASGELMFADIWNANPWNTTDNGTGWYRVRVSLTDPYGRVLVNDSGDNISGYYVFYIDRSEPLWSSVGSNESSPDPLDYVEFYANWSDASLDTWEFEWNVSGGFAVNGSGSFGSGTWSNVTRQIPGESELKTIGYRFRATDSEGNENVTDVFAVDVGDVTPPVIGQEKAEPELVNRHDWANITAVVSDNSGGAAHVWAVIGIPGGGYINESMGLLGGNMWNLSYQVSERGEYNFTVWANDSSGNTDNGSVHAWLSYGWANVSWTGPSAGSYPKGSMELVCRVVDANLSSGIGGYPVEFWDNGMSLGSNVTNSSGYAVFMWDTSGEDDGGHVLNCTIADNESLFYNDSVGVDSVDVTLLAPQVDVVLLEHENLYEHGVNEYESGDEIGWVNVTVNNTGGSVAGSVNVTLNVVDGSGSVVSWFSEVSRDCGTLQVGELCEAGFGAQGIAGTVSGGRYYWNVTVNWSGGGSPPEVNSSEWFTVHRVSDNVSSSLEPVKVLQNGSVVYNVTVGNPWSANLTGVNVTVNCPENMTCLCLLSGQESNEWCRLGNITSGENATASFNITTKSSTVPGDYDLNATVNYTNPGMEERSLEGQGNRILSVRGPTKLSVVITAYEASLVRGGLYELRGYVNNTGDSVTNNVWLNWTLPAGWSNYSGSLNVFSSSLGSGGMLWNNITVNVSMGAALGTQDVELHSESDEEAEDWDSVETDVYAGTNVTWVWVNESSPYRNGSIRMEGRMVYDNGTGVEGENLEFRVGGVMIGSNSTNSSGHAVLYGVVPYNMGLGSNSMNVSYDGSSGMFTKESYNDTGSVDVQDELTIENVQASPETEGYGQNVTLTADVWSRVSLDWVRVNLTYPNGSSYWIEMEHAGGNTYRLVFQDTWQWGNYSFWVNASNMAGFGNDTSSQEGEFYVRAGTYIDVVTRDDTIGPAQNVSLERREWWNRSYLFRMRVNITEESGDNLTDYQVNVTINTSRLISLSRMQSDCSDARFVIYNQTTGEYTGLSYWFSRDECNTSETEFWVRMPYLGAGETTEIEFYYGNGTVDNAANISSTFVFGDDFDRADSAIVGNGWAEDYPSYASIENGMLKIASGVSTGTYREQVHHSFAQPGMDYVLEYRGNSSQTGKYVYSNYFGESSNTRFSLIFGSDGKIKYLNGSVFEDTSVSYSSGMFYDFMIWYNDTTGNVNYYVNGSLEGEDKRPSTGPLQNEVAFGGELGSTAYWDDVRIRKRASKEPSVEVG
ncbi:MAG: hypothetical protein DRO99_04375, partial [Candidatus Aenigmatarchaeota archaeon]